MSNMKNNSNGSGQRMGSMDDSAMKPHRHDMSSDRLSENAAKDCGPARRVADIEPHMEVIASCGCNVGKVDHMEGNAIKLTRNDSPDGQHHFIPTSWVNRVDEHVHLSKDMEEAQREWKPDAAGCSASGM